MWVNGVALSGEDRVLRTQIVEATNTRGVWGGFLVGRIADEWGRVSRVSDTPMSLLAEAGYEATAMLVVDLDTGNGAVFTPPERRVDFTDAQWVNVARITARFDLNTNHQIQVSPLFESFLAWLYVQEPFEFDALPDHIELNAPSVVHGYRRMRLITGGAAPKSVVPKSGGEA
jgi:hypothetical protein